MTVAFTAPCINISTTTTTTIRYIINDSCLLRCSGIGGKLRNHAVAGWSDEYSIRRDILNGYDRTIRPLRNARMTMNVSIGVDVERLETVCQLQSSSF